MSFKNKVARVLTRVEERYEQYPVLTGVQLAGAIFLIVALVVINL